MVAGNGLYPYGFGAGRILEYESGGFLKQDIIMFNFNTRFSRKVSLQGNYQYAHAKDLPGTPTNPYNFLQDYGTSNLNRRSNLTVIGTIQAPLKIVIAPTVIVHSGSPYDVTVGTDIYGDNGSARGLFASSSAACNSAAGIYCTPLGNFSTNYPAGLLNGPAVPANLVPRNYFDYKAGCYLGEHAHLPCVRLRREESRRGGRDAFRRRWWSRRRWSWWRRTGRRRSWWRRTGRR